MKTLIFFSLYALQLNAQLPDTIYSGPYPTGIVTNKITTSVLGSYHFNPIKSPDLNIDLAKNEIKSIHYGSGKVFENGNFKESDIVLFPTDKETGKILFAGILEFKGVDVKHLYNAVKTIPQGQLKMILIAEDVTDFSFQKYQGTCNVKWGGDAYLIKFDFLVKFKDSKIKYEFSDFVMQRTKMKLKVSATMMAANMSEDKTQKPLDIWYADDHRNGRQDYFWSPIKTGVSNLITSIKKACEEQTPGKKNDW